jgi:hypothetical protein
VKHKYKKAGMASGQRNSQELKGRGHCILTKGSIHQKTITIPHAYIHMTGLQYAKTNKY